MISGLVLKYLKVERLIILRGYESPLPGSIKVPLTRPSCHLSEWTVPTNLRR